MLKYILFSLLVMQLSLASAQINHVEPPGWWIGMNNAVLQLLIHGVDVGSTTPSIDYPGVTIKKIHKADSRNYLFIDLEIESTTKPGDFIIQFNKDGKTVYTYPYQLARKQHTATIGFDASDVIYLIVPDRFANGDYSNDVVEGMREQQINRSFEGGRHGGDIRGIINHLDYIAEMGYTTIWPTPMLENNMNVYSYHGYSITNHYKVDPRFGTLDDYITLSVKARAKGIKLIFDDVLNHIGLNHWWMNDLPFNDWINYKDSFQLTNHRRTINQDPYASKYDSKLMAQGWFDKTMPDINGRNPFLANYLIQRTLWWIEKLQLGGIRQDTYCYSDKELLQKWSCRVMQEYPNLNIVGEEWSLNPMITSYWQQGNKNKDGYSNCLKTIMDFPLQAALIQALNDTAANDYGTGLIKLYEALANDFAYPDKSNILVMCDNHDMNRIYMQLNRNISLTKMALTYILTVRGIPQLFYGTEILMDNTGYHKNDGIIRSDFPGGWKEDKINAFSGAGLTPEQLEMQQWLQQLLNWRKKNDVIAHGKTLHFAPFNNCYVFFRYSNSGTVMVVINKNKNKVELPMHRFDEMKLAGKSFKEVITKKTYGKGEVLSIEPMTANVFEVY